LLSLTKKNLIVLKKSYNALVTVEIIHDSQPSSSESSVEDQPDQELSLLPQEKSVSLVPLSHV
jgi:hypothetical protein